MSKLGVAILSHSRPNYLREVLQSLKIQWDQDFSPYLFQDGVFNWASGRKSCEEKDIQKCMEVWEEEGFTRERVYVPTCNLGPSWMGWKLREEMFKRYEYLLTLEDDYVLTEDYVGAIKILLAQFMGAKELAEVSPSQLTGSVGMVTAHGDHRSPRDKEERDRRAFETFSEKFHIWAYGMTRWSWSILRGKFWEFLGLMGDFELRDDGKIRDWFLQHGCWQEATGTDAGLWCSTFWNGLAPLNTVVNRGRYIGEVGIHMTPKLFREWDWSSLPAEPYSLREFQEPEEKYRLERFFDQLRSPR